MIRSIIWEIKLQTKGALRYRFGILSDMLIYSLLLVFFICSGTGKSYSEVYGKADYRELLLAGYIAWFYAVTAITTGAQCVMEELRAGTFYRKLNADYPLQVLLFGRLTAALLLQSIIAAVLFGAAVLLGQMKLWNQLMIIFPIFLSTLGMYGIGLMVAGLSLFYKRIGALTYLIQLGLLFVTDTVPGAVMGLTRYIPLTICNDIIRKEISGISCRGEGGILFLTSLSFLAAGVLFFQLLLKKAKIKGNLLFY